MHFITNGKNKKWNDFSGLAHKSAQVLTTDRFFTKANNNIIAFDSEKKRKKNFKSILWKIERFIDWIAEQTTHESWLAANPFFSLALREPNPQVVLKMKDLCDD